MTEAKGAQFLWSDMPVKGHLATQEIVGMIIVR